MSSAFVTIGLRAFWGTLEGRWGWNEGSSRAGWALDEREVVFFNNYEVVLYSWIQAVAFSFFTRHIIMCHKRTIE